MKNKLQTQKKISSTDKKNNIKKQIEKRKKLTKLNLKNVENNKKDNQIKKPSDTIRTKKSIKANQNDNKIKKNKFTFIRICKNLEECDIDKISKIVMDIGKQKDFPDINN